MKKQLLNILPYTILLISISSILQWCSLPIGNTFLWWLLQSTILFIFFYLSPKCYSIFPIKIFLIYVAFSAIYGAIYMTENYWDWKLLVSNLMSMLLLISVYTFSTPILLAIILRSWYKYGWIIFIVLCPFLGSDAFGRYLVPYAFLSIFISILYSKKYLYAIGIALMITIYFGYEDRSNTIKFLVYLLMGISLIYWKYWKNKSKFIFRSIHCAFLFLPFVFLFLAITNKFNIFNIGEELHIKETPINKEQLADTRTLLYVEEITSAINNNYLIQGRSIARGYDSLLFGKNIGKSLGTNNNERPSCEVCILNIFNYMGIIGVLLYFFIFYRASYLAIYKSNNQYVKMMGIYIAFRWMYAFIHDGIEFNLNFLFIIIGLAICYSPQFRKMNAWEFRLFIYKCTKIN